MGNRLKEDEKTEAIIRGLLRLPENRRCINCNSLGPQYVCTTFFTFVCTSCSGVHREFTHRVKSVSMAKFSEEEVGSLQVGGNERARQIYLKEWDHLRNSFPDGSNLQRLREFIKHVYVDRKYTGERSMGLSRLRLSAKEEPSETRKIDAFHGRSRSLHDYDKPAEQQSSPHGNTDNRNVKYYYDERRSPRYYSQENSRSGGFKRNPIRLEIVDDRFRDEGSGNRRFSSRESKVQNRSPDKRKNMERSSSPVMSHLREILGENIHSLRVGQISKPNDGKDAHGSAEIQKKSLPYTQESAPMDLVECEKINLESLIDFNVEPEPQNNKLRSDPQQICSSDNSNNWASFDLQVIEMTSQPPRQDTLENLLFDLSVPPSTTPSGSASQTPELLSSDANAQEAIAGTPQTLGSNGAIVKGSERQLVAMQQHPLPSLKTSDSFTSPQTTPSVGSVNYELRTSSAPLAQRSLSFSAKHLSHSMSIPAAGASSGKELPSDLFAASYSSPPALSVSSCQTPPSPGMGVNMHYYPNAMPVAAFPSLAKSANPFDINDERGIFQTSIPSMASLQASIPYVSSPGDLTRSSDLRTNLAQLKAPHPPSNMSMMPPQSPSGSAMFPSAYMGQQVHSILPRPQGTGGFGINAAASSFSLNSIQQPTGSGEYSAPNPGNPSPFYARGGNPFG